MPHPIWGPPDHELETVTITLTLGTRRNGRHTKVQAHGSSSTRRVPLWSVSEAWTSGEVQAGLQPGDAIHHIALVALQDRPTSQNHMERSLMGEGWEQLSLDV
jgi:hypothetical protein